MKWVRNVDKGAARGSKKEFIYFLTIICGSLSELETQLIIAKELNYIDSLDEIMKKIDKIFGLLGGLIKSLHKRK